MELTKLWLVFSLKIVKYIKYTIENRWMNVSFMLDDGMACQQQSKLTFLEGGKVAVFCYFEDSSF